MESKEGDGIDLKFLQSRIKSLKNGKFTLAVAGEVKAGKSTFINALLGIELLPSDVLQATSAIVEIFKSEKPYLKVKYADGHEEEIYDDLGTSDVNEARKRLHEICKISDKYRSIPTTLIDEYIAASDAPIQLSEALIKELECESSSNGLFEKKNLLNDYIASRPKSSIPIEIQFGYPLKWDFDELRIVDTPGVNAVGGVQNVSFSYFEDANAILFTHPIKPIESESFSKFVNKIISNRSRETLFLVLTHASLYSETDIEKLHGDAIRIYSQFIPAERILVVDSLLQLIIHDFNNGKTQEEIEKESEQKSDILAKFEKRAKKAGKTLLELLEESSGFNKVCSAIDLFSMQAPNLQLCEILQSLRDGYAKQEEEYNARVELLESKKRDPQEFENEINRINSALEEYKLLLNNTKEDIIRNYTGKHAEWQTKINELKVKYPEQITKCTDFETVRKSFTDGQYEIIAIIDQLTTSLTNELKAKLTKIGESFKEDKKITLPKIDLKSIESETKKQAFRVEEDYEYRVESIWDNWNWLRFKWTKSSRTYRVKTGEKQVYDKEEHLKSFKTTCNEKFYELINGLPQQSKNLLDTYLGLFSKSVNKAINDRQDALQSVLKKKESNEELIAQISDLRKKKGLLPQETLRINALLEDLL
ncbi:MAG TPA: dynamin family protein [Bacteroidales bacterium]|nr:dynamin family protein [Bacteroidales bacterium]